MRRTAERCAPAPAHEPAPDVIIDSDQVPISRRASDYGGDLGGKLGDDPFVGIDFENPIAAARRDPGIAPLPFALPGALNYPLGELPGYLGRGIIAEVEHDDDLVGKAEAGQAVGQLMFFVARDNESGKDRSPQSTGGHSRLFYRGNAHAASLTARRRSRIAAASTASTDRLSISVPVVR